jgi:hypothetical protein
LQYSTSYAAKYELIGKSLQLTDGLTLSSSSDGCIIPQSSVEAAVHWNSKSVLLDEPPVDASAVLVSAYHSGCGNIESVYCYKYGMC